MPIKQVGMLDMLYCPGLLKDSFCQTIYFCFGCNLNCALVIGCVTCSLWNSMTWSVYISQSWFFSFFIFVFFFYFDYVFNVTFPLSLRFSVFFVMWVVLGRRWVVGSLPGPDFLPSAHLLYLVCKVFIQSSLTLFSSESISGHTHFLYTRLLPFPITFSCKVCSWFL